MPGFSPGCKDCCGLLTIHILNVNAIIDDNFDIQLNGTTIGSTSLNTNDCKGKIFTEAVDFNVARDFCTAGFLCCATPADFNGVFCVGAATDCTPLQTATTGVDKTLKVPGANTLVMANTLNNGHGNFGRVWIGTIVWNGTNYVMKTTYMSYLDGFYNDASGVSFTFPFTI